MGKVDRSFPFDSRGSVDSLPVRLQGVLEEETVALDDLERAVAATRPTLLGQDLAEILELVQLSEELLARVMRLESERVRISVKMNASAEGHRGSDLEVASGITGRSEPSRFQSSYQHLQRKNEAIAWQNEANGLLVDGLIRVASASILKLTRLREAEAHIQSPMPGNDVLLKSSVAVDIHA